MDIEKYCDRADLHIWKQNNKVLKTKASYTLSKPQVKKVCEWLKNIKFPDGYASNIGGCVNLNDSSFYSFKSHECHVFMQRLLPIALKGMIPNAIWDAITELCTFFRVICSKELHIEDLETLKDSIVVTICKLEKVFPPGFFDSMEHLVIHLVNEAINGGPEQYRWMYLYERKLGSLKRTIRNRARPEGSIVEAHRVSELSIYSPFQFETPLNRVPRNCAFEIPTYANTDPRLSIFKVPSRRLFHKSGHKRYLDEFEKHKIQTYILLNCVEVHPSITLFNNWIRQTHPNIEERELDQFREQDFASWFADHILSGSDPSNEHLKDLAYGPINEVTSHKGYIVNGYKFHTLAHGGGRVTNNTGVCVKGSCYNEEESDYYGELEEVIELVDIKYRSRGCIYDPFILAYQAQQVYYATYPSTTKDLKDWWAVVKAMPRGIFQVAEGILASEISGDDNVTLVREEIEEVQTTLVTDDTNDDGEEEEFEDTNGDDDSSDDIDLDSFNHSSDDDA
ncbi:putative transposon, En/Spm-like protein [Tanacetum coccineum]|uniref:Transposon, En/Spm-like protein n=1 Tax=Tanacetum coccineum TaxID=301880 RepID=A0ABQ5F445_9ASTR